MASNTQNVKLGVCQVTFDGKDLGYTKGGVEVTVDTETYKIEVDQFGRSPIGERIMGRTVQAVVPLAETTLENLISIMPGATMVQTGGVKATGTITFSTGAPSADDTVTINGVTYTFKASPASEYEVAVGSTFTEAATNLMAKIAQSVDPRILTADYSRAAGVITVTYESYGTIGNSFTLAKSGDNIAVSGATLASGADSTGAKVNVPNAVGTDLLAIAKKLVFHPQDLAVTNRSEDFTIPLAATPGALSFAYKFDEERIYNVTFMGYPDSVTKVLFVVGDEAVTA